LNDVQEPQTSQNAPFLERFKYLIFLVVALATLSGIVALLLSRPKPVTIAVNPPEPTVPPSPTPIPSSTPTPGPYMVYVTGAVATPELIITLEFGSRVFHALAAAGGASTNADLSRVNLAQILADGDHIHVPTRVSDGDVAPAGDMAVFVVTPTPGSYTVYVTGEVKQPELLVALPAGSRVEDAIAAAGGATDNADLGRINLSQILNDGDLIYVPPLAGDQIQTPTPNRPPLIHINHASVDELDTLPGIGPTLAQAIIDYRTENGPFQDLADLDNVPGIGTAKLEAIRDFVVFD